MLGIESKTSFNNAVAITPNDNTRIQATRALYVGTTGNLVVVMPDGTSVTLNAVPVGLLPISVVGVKATGTTASNIVAFNYVETVV